MKAPNRKNSRLFGLPPRSRPGSASPPRNGHAYFEDCSIFRPDLDLYAEGELRGSASLFRLRQHLQVCESCQDYLVAYDELTREILAGAHPEGCCAPGEEMRLEVQGHCRHRRVQSILQLVEKARLDDLRAAEGPAQIRGLWWGRFARLAFPAAAALLVAGLLATFGFSFWPREGAPASGIAELSETSRRQEGAEDLSPPASLALARENNGLRWILDSRSASGRGVRLARGPGSRFRLYGFRLPSKAMANEDPEWMVDAALAARGRLLSSDQFFLVPESPSDSSDPGGAIEIDPLAWSEGGGAEGGSRRIEVVQLHKGPAFYRVYVLHGPQTLRGSGPYLPVERRPAPLPLLDNPRARPWGLTATLAPPQGTHLTN